MSRHMFVPLASILAIVMPMQALDTLQLRDKAVITGKVLAEKADLLVVDLGYTVINVPRSAVVKVLHGTGVAEPAPTKTMPQTAAALPVAEASKGLYSISSGGLSERSVRELAGQLGEGVVQVRTPSGLGSGFFINEDGHLITNFHVIEGETKISVEVYHVKDGQLERHSYKDVKIIAMNKFGDLSLLKVEDKDAPKFKSVYLGDSDPLVVGDKVFAIGSPQGLERTVTEGILSTKARQFQGALYLQTTTQINPGNSGGPLFNLRGEVVGVTNMKLNFSEGLAFAIPVEQVRWFLDHRDAFAYDTDNPSNAFRYLEPPRHLRDVVVEKP